MAISAARPSPCGTSESTASWSPCALAAATTTPRPSTKTRKPGSAARRLLARAHARASDGQRERPATAANTGSTSRKPGQRERQDGEREPRRLRRRADGSGAAPAAADRRRTTATSATHSTAIATSHGSTISAPKRANESPLASNASRFVRLLTGSSSDALLARCEHAYTCGRALKRSLEAVANTTGVEQDDGGVEAQHRGRSGRRGEHERQQPPRLAPRPERHRPAEVVEQPLAPAAVGEHQQRGGEADRRPEVLQRVAGLLRARSSRRDEQQRRAGGDRPVGRSAGVRDGGGERRDKRREREDTAHRPGSVNAAERVSEGTRTPDRLDHNQELYQLSYAHHGDLRVT